MKCPKCKTAQPDGGEECIHCGIVFEKFYEIRERRRQRLQKKEVDSFSPDQEDSTETSGLIGSLIHHYFWGPLQTPWRPMMKSHVILLGLLFTYIFYSITREPYYQLFPSMKPMEYMIPKLFQRVDLIFHEGGHWIFAIFGNRTMAIFGGSLNQVLVPCIVLGAFWMRRDASGFAFGLMWVGINLMEVGIYMADARKPVLPLIGGMDSFVAHDWRNLFNHWDLWTKDVAIAKTTYYLGWYGMLFGLLWFAWTGFRNMSDEGPPLEPM